MFSIFKTRKIRQFNLPTQYYDERKERLDRLKDKYDHEDAPEISVERSRKKDFRREWENRSYREHSAENFKELGNGRSNIRLGVIMAILMFLAWFFLIR